MKDNIELLELVYLYLKNKKSSNTFKNIWNYIISKNNLIIHRKTSKEDVIAELYIDLVLDNRFVLTNEGMWGLREFLKYDEIKKQYDYIDQFETTKEFENFNLNNEKKDIFVKTKVNDNLIDNDHYINYENEIVTAK